MKKNIRLSLTVLLVTLMLLACEKKENTLSVDSEIKEVNIFKSTEFKKVDSEFVVSANKTDHPELLELVENILSDATKQDGVVDTVAPNYYLEIIYSDNIRKDFYLWLSDAEGVIGSLMKTEDTHTIYNFSEELNNELIGLLNSPLK